MAFDWKEYVEVARFLDAHAGTAIPQEAARRAAVSRTYFAAFCFARNYARDRLGFVPRNDPDDHGRLMAHLKSRRFAVARKLGQLRLWRNDSDYVDDLTTVDLSKLTAAGLVEAEYIFRALQPPAKS